MSSLATLLVVLSVLPAPTPADAREAARSVLSGDYQTELPGDPGSSSGATIAPGLPPETGRGPEREVPWRIGGGGAGTVLLFLLYAVLAVFLALFIASLVRDRGTAHAARRASPGPRDAPRAESMAPAPAPAFAPAVLEPWEELAAEGRFEEAVHALLIAAIADLRARTKAPPDSATSREILRSPAVPAEAATALGALVAVVETSRFGGRPVAAPDYERARNRFGEWRAALDGRRR